MRLSRDPLANPEPLIRRVYAYVAYRIGDGPDAEDVTSETFARALRYRDSFDPKRGEPIGWLIGIARRCIADLALTRPTQELDESHDAAAPGDLAEDVVRRLDLRAAVAQLDEAGRELVALRFGADLTARQIGELTGKKTHAVEVALQRPRAAWPRRRRASGTRSPTSRRRSTSPRRRHTREPTGRRALRATSTAARRAASRPRTTGATPRSAPRTGSCSATSRWPASTTS